MNRAMLGLMLVLSTIGSTAMAEGISGDDCKDEPYTGAEVCITVTDADINCQESYDQTYYSSCGVDVSYIVSTDYDGDDYLDVDVECSIELHYKKKYGFLQIDYDDESESHTFYSYGSETGEMNFDFTFSSFDVVYSVNAKSVECSINDINEY